MSVIEVPGICTYCSRSLGRTRLIKKRTLGMNRFQPGEFAACAPCRELNRGLWKYVKEPGNHLMR